jgi:AcrR family transcriptional regulator
MNKDKISTRDQIVKTASRLFHSQGYHLTGINQIIKEAGIAKASLYYHFRSKEDLCVAYLKRRYEIWFSLLNNYLESVSDPSERIIKAFECRGQYLLDTHFGGCTYLRITSEMPRRSRKISIQAILQKEKHHQFFQEEVKKIKWKGRGNKTLDTNDLAHMIFIMFDGATAQCQIYRELWPIDYAIKAVKELLSKWDL